MRLLAVPLMVWLILVGHYGSAFWVFVAAGISDAVDGYLAKRFNLATVLGSYIDPIADKVLLVSVYVTLGQGGRIADWLVILIVFRDAVLVGGFLLSHMLGRSLRMKPILVSKLNTAAQIVLAAVVLADLGLGIEDYGLGGLLVYVVAATTVVSGATYLVLWMTGTGRTTPTSARRRAPPHRSRKVAAEPLAVATAKPDASSPRASGEQT